MPTEPKTQEPLTLADKVAIQAEADRKRAKSDRRSLNRLTKVLDEFWLEEVTIQRTESLETFEEASGDTIRVTIFAKKR